MGRVVPAHVVFGEMPAENEVTGVQARAGPGS
jgi:hypothetical protein